MSISNLKASILAHITAIAAAEKITRASLGEISRELIMYVPDTKDIDLVNRLLGVLTPMNRATAVLYFKHFLPWDWEKDANKFGSMMQGDKKLAKAECKFRFQLENETVDINGEMLVGKPEERIKKKNGI